MTDSAHIVRFHPAGALALFIAGPASPAVAKRDAPPLPEKQPRRLGVPRRLTALRPAQV
jgi:hypothetical protein